MYIKLTPTERGLAKTPVDGYTMWAVVQNKFGFDNSQAKEIMEKMDSVKLGNHIIYEGEFYQWEDDDE